MIKTKLIVGLLLLISASAIAQESDHQKIALFEERVSELRHQINNAITSEQLNKLEVELSELQAGFNNYEQLIDRVYYPNTFQDIVTRLNSTLLTNEHRLLLIEHQREQLFDLTNQLTAHRAEISRLYTESDSLKKEIIASQVSEAQLSEMITSYRKQLLARDKLVFEMIDSLLITQKNRFIQSLNEEDLQNYRISGDDNPLPWIQAILNENIEFTRHQNRLLDVEDHIRMFALQHHFENTWSQVGDDLITVYGGNFKTQTAHAIEEAIREWRMVSNHRMWTSMQQHLEFSGIEVKGFDNKESFFEAFDSLIEQGRALSEREILTSNGYAEYQKISRFWSSTFKNQWNHLSDQTSLLTDDHIALIDVALTEWEEQSKPIHPMLVAILSLMMVSVMGFILVLLRSKAVR